MSIVAWDFSRTDLLAGCVPIGGMGVSGMAISGGVLTTTGSVGTIASEGMWCSIHGSQPFGLCSMCEYEKALYYQKVQQAQMTPSHHIAAQAFTNSVNTEKVFPAKAKKLLLIKRCPR